MLVYYDWQKHKPGAEKYDHCQGPVAFLLWSEILE
jgi:hypothetical protein